MSLKNRVINYYLARKERLNKGRKESNNPPEETYQANNSGLRESSEIDAHEFLYLRQKADGVV